MPEFNTLSDGFALTSVRLLARDHPATNPFCLSIGDIATLLASTLPFLTQAEIEALPVATHDHTEFLTQAEIEALPVATHDHTEFLTQAEIEALPGFGGSGGAVDFAIIQDVKSPSTAGGSSVAGTYQTRDLNTIVFNTLGVTLNANQITLPDRACLVIAAAPTYQSSRCHLQIYDTIQANELYHGLTVCSYPGEIVCLCARVVGVVAGNKTIEIRQWSEIARADYGLGLEAVGGASSVFTDVLIVGV